ncbi:hypothetical protein POTOM_003029 [Populus tomentosa]|uniref:Uncharacterized protein n=1 Tax=Populus tomentosa TaxID=118781 RepID=A0A8X8DL12_POPTO|nr:hypothetical protein POTOM_003029 [Populus tomentosa]
MILLSAKVNAILRKPRTNQVPKHLIKEKVCAVLKVKEKVDFRKSEHFKKNWFWADCIDMKIYPFEQNSLWASKGEVKELSKKNFIDYFKILEGEPGDKIYLPLIPSHRFFYSFETLENLSMVSLYVLTLSLNPEFVGPVCCEKEGVGKGLFGMR